MTTLSASQPGEQWVGIRRAASLSGRSPFTVQRLALIGKIRVQIERGQCPRYLTSDLQAIRDEGR